MQPELIVVRLGELTLKGKNRMRFENKILSQLQNVLQDYPDCVISREYGRVYVHLHVTDYRSVANQVKQVFGVESFCPAYQSELDLEAIRKKALIIAKGQPHVPTTFKVYVRRVNKMFPYASHEMNHLVGGYVLQACPWLKVDVHHPELELRIEIREQGALLYTYSEMEEAAGGFPLGMSGKGMLLLSGGIDSPVAGWMAMRRGLEIEAVHFHSYPYTSERAKQKVIELARILSRYGGIIKLHLVPFTEIQTRIHQEYRENLLITIYRRCMYRIAEKLAEKRKALALVTGESLGQVASQTLTSMNVIGRVVEMPIIQPLVTLDKKEIVKVAQEIGTFETSILPYEDCCTIFMPKSPSTKPNLKLIETIEKGMPWLPELIDRAVEETEMIVLKPEKTEQLDHLF